jgi:flagellar FliJ protein
MKGFRFRLDRILKLREDAEQRQAQVLGAALREESTLDELQAAGAQQLNQITEQLALKPGAVAHAGLLRVLGLTAEAATSQLAAVEQSREEARKVVEAERDRLAAARVERKSLERLREHHLEAFQRDQNQREQKRLDEIAGRPKPKEDGR